MSLTLLPDDFLQKLHTTSSIERIAGSGQPQ